MKKLFLLLLVALSYLSISAQDSLKISLLTFDTGLESYSVFGHTAIRVQNPKTNQDIVYNYGMFDFDTPNFLLKFIKGELDYKVGIEDFDLMLRSYARDRRQVYEQVLNLNNEQATQFLEKLEFAYRPENRYYRYGFLHRNCSTELRELIFTQISNINYTATETKHTYRYYLKNYTKPMPWLKFGINLALGSLIDVKIDSYDLMFLPNFLSEEVEKATINNESLATNGIKLLNKMKHKRPNRWTLTPFILFSFLFVIMVLGKSPVLNQIFTFSVGIGGLIILIITLISAHTEVQNNYNLLWCNPFYLMSFVLSFTQYKKLKKMLAILMTLCLLTTLGVWFSNIQGYDIAFFPIVISLLWLNIKQAQSS